VENEGDGYIGRDNLHTLKPLTHAGFLPGDKAHLSDAVNHLLPDVIRPATRIKQYLFITSSTST